MQNSKDTRTPSPSIQGSAPVADILNRIWVEDPRRKFAGIYNRRMTDFEGRRPFLLSGVAFALAVVLVGGMWSAFVRIFSASWTLSPPAAPITTVAKTHVAPKMTGTASRIAERASALPVPRSEPTIAPENLRVRFLGPRTLELQWDSLGEEYNYRVYTAISAALQDARPLSENWIQANHTAWMPDDGIQDIWVVVQGIDRQGHKTAFSMPRLVRIPS